MTNETTTSKTLKGTVVSDKMDKTVVVRVNRYIKHPKYKKYITRSKRYKAHDENNTYHTGDTVFIKEVRSISKDKHFTVVSKA